MAIKQKDPNTGRSWIDLTGDTFGRWTVLQCTGRRPDASGKPLGATLWKCLCSCGATKENVNYGALVGGTSQSCGCGRTEVLKLRAKKHGDSNCQAYRAWQQAKDRCFNRNRPSWNHYGGRGITMCSAMRDSYEAFRDTIGPAPSLKHSVDRRDNEGNYSCGKCMECLLKGWGLNIRWAERLTQAANTRATQRVMWEGCLRSLTEVARMENVAFCSLRNRIIQQKMRTGDAIADCRARGLMFNERAKTILEANPNIVTRPPKNRRVRGKSVPIPVA